MTLEIMSRRMRAWLTSGSCWVEMTTASTRFGLLSTYSTVTWDLASRTQVREPVSSADRPQLLEQLVRQDDRQGHELRRLAAGVAKHHSLIAGALLAAGTLVDAHGDVGRLLVQSHHDAATAIVESVFRFRVADALDRRAHETLDVNLRFPSSLRPPRRPDRS